MQSLPSGVPGLVIPNEAKVDLKHLRADLPKYATAGLTSVTVEWWQSFIDTLENSMKEQLSSDSALPSSSWLYSDLLQLSRTGIRRARSMASLPSQLIAMREMETNPLPEVYISCIWYYLWCDCIFMQGINNVVGEPNIETSELGCVHQAYLETHVQFLHNIAVLWK